MTDYAAPANEPPAGAVAGSRASFGIRFLAALIDGVLLGVIQFVLQAAIGGAGVALSLVVSLGYYTYLEGESGQTLGKRATGIRVVGIQDGAPIGYGRAAIRWVGRIASAIVIFLGYLWMLWDPEKQTWHDKFAESVVINARAA